MYSLTTTYHQLGSGMEGERREGQGQLKTQSQALQGGGKMTHTWEPMGSLPTKHTGSGSQTQGKGWGAGSSTPARGGPLVDYCIGRKEGLGC